MEYICPIFIWIISLLNILIEADQNKLSVFATDLEVSLTDSAPAKIHQSGKVAVSAKKLFEIIKELSEGPIKLIKKENNWLTIEQGKYRSQLVGVSAEEYPIFPTYNSESFLKINGPTLKDMIDKTSFSISNDETRYYLNGVLFEIQPSQGFKMIATDGHRLSFINKQVNDLKNSINQGVIIPRKGLFEIKKLLENVESSVEIAIEGSQFILKFDSTVLMIRLIEGKYPNYNQFIPSKLQQKVIINREKFLGSLKKVSMMANEKSKAVLLNLSKGKMEISSNNPELGDAKDEIEIQYNGSDMKIGFNARYIQDVLNNMTFDEVDFEFNDQVSPGVIRPHDDKNYTCVVMPMRI